MDNLGLKLLLYAAFCRSERKRNIETLNLNGEHFNAECFFVGDEENFQHSYPYCQDKSIFIS